jgi:hypothetical protein
MQHVSLFPAYPSGIYGRIPLDIETALPLQLLSLINRPTCPWHGFISCEVVRLDFVLVVAAVECQLIRQLFIIGMQGCRGVSNDNDNTSGSLFLSSPSLDGGPRIGSKDSRNLGNQVEKHIDWTGKRHELNSIN